MAKMRGLAAALILLAGCAAAPSPAAPPASGHRLPAESISFEINSWGSPMESFRIASDGTGEYSKAPEFRAPVQTRRFDAGPAGFAQIRAALADIEHFSSHEPACGSRATDFPYGQVVWQAGTARAAVGFDVGCQSAEMQRVVSAAHRAARLAEQFSQTNAAQ
jgi:hypothetical protein